MCLKFVSNSKNYALIALFSASLVGCTSENSRTIKGGVGGAVVGGVVGAATGGAKGAAIGAAAGGVTGAAVGAYLDRRKKELSTVVKTEKTENGLLVTLKNDILFDFNKTDLKPVAHETLGKLAKILVKYPKDELRVAGFTDSVGSDAYNKTLSDKRAASVKEYLTSQGVKDEQVKSIGMGEDPKQATDEAGRQSARRVEIYIEPEIPADVGQG